MPAVEGKTVRVLGLQELSRAFAIAGGSLSRELRTALREAAEPIRKDAEVLAVDQIANIGIPWSRMRIGVTRTSVYVAPRERGTRSRSKRPNLAGLLLGRSMIPALDHNIGGTVERVDHVLATVAREWEAV